MLRKRGLLYAAYIALHRLLRVPMGTASDVFSPPFPRLPPQSPSICLPAIPLALPLCIFLLHPTKLRILVSLFPRTQDLAHRPSGTQAHRGGVRGTGAVSALQHLSAYFCLSHNLVLFFFFASPKRVSVHVWRPKLPVGLLDPDPCMRHPPFHPPLPNVHLPRRQEGYEGARGHTGICRCEGGVGEGGPPQRSSAPQPRPQPAWGAHVTATGWDYTQPLTSPPPQDEVLQGKPKNGRLKTGSRGPLSNVALWKKLLHELDSPLRTVRWVKVPLYVGIQGNEEADSLVEDGRLSSPLLRHSVAPQARNIRQSLVPQRGTGLPSRPEPILISDSLSTLSDDKPSTPLASSQTSSAQVAFDTFASNQSVISPMTPQPGHQVTVTNCTPSPRFLSLADSPAARLLSTLDLQEHPSFLFLRDTVHRQCLHSEHCVFGRH